MKKFFFALFILAIVAGAGLYFGWAQAKVPPGSYGVLRSKTHGTDPEVIRTGEFRWIWYKLIPTNAETVVFTPRRLSQPLNVSGTLPSARQYAYLAGIDSDFSWRISGDFSFTLKPEYFPALVERENLANQTDFLAFENHYLSAIDAFIQQYFEKLSEDDVIMESLLDSRSFAELTNAVEAAFPEIEDTTCFVTGISGPDFTIYRAVKALYDDYLSQFHLALSNMALLDAESRINQRLRIDELTLMGELLTQFPVLLDYLALDRDAP